MEPDQTTQNSFKNSVLLARRNLELSLGDDWQKYIFHLRKFFRNGNKKGKQKYNRYLIKL